ncbi:histone-like nucleoid-structuring protein Lsr2 [Demequina aurantiaca]|uniref:histone-like nucleoid-structuring protein Lsr2 n=1 Tax=Demequina aurantiaca TaxID=676200 RepID=UPI0007839C03|nr:Lsr2 family protein [Demequina aurantiaca]
MAQKIQVVLVDDFDGGDATETIGFALDGVAYEIDLNATHASELRAAFSTYVEAGRRTAGKKSAARPRTKGDVAKIRAWAQANGHEVSSRGRIPAKVREAYYAAQ